MTKIINHINNSLTNSNLIKELQKKEFVINRLMQDKRITERFLNTSIDELQSANKQIQIFKAKELLIKDLQLKTKETQLTQLVNSMPMAMSLVGLDYRYKRFNHLYEVWFGLDITKIIGRKVVDVVGEKIFENYSKPNLDKAFKGENASVESAITLKDKTKMFLRTHYVPAYGTDSIIIGAYVFSDDISLLKKKEDELSDAKSNLELKNEELKKYIDSNMQLENFAHIASHDLKAPLKTIMSFADLLLSNRTHNRDEHELKCLNIISRSAVGMQGLIDSLLKYAKLDVEVIIPQQFALSTLLSEVCIDLMSTLKDNNATVHYENINANIEADYFKMKQLFQNLISNGIKFSKANVDAIINIHFEEHKDFWQCSIEDNGIGIDEKYLQKIFLIFNKLHNNEMYEGSGIGLAIAKKIVEQHHGELTATSQLGKGSTFKFTIKKGIASII